MSDILLRGILYQGSKYILYYVWVTKFFQKRDLTNGSAWYTLSLPVRSGWKIHGIADVSYT